MFLPVLVAGLVAAELPAQPVPVQLRGAASEGSAPAENPAGGDASEAIALPGDRVVLRIWNEPEMSDTFTVARSGEVILPRLGSVRVDDRPIGELERSLRESYGTYLRNPSVEVKVLRRVSVVGEVREPGIYLADLTMTLPDIVARAGGVTEAGHPERITIFRGVEQLAFRRGEREKMLVAELRSGDQVVVGRRSFLERNPWAAISTGFGLMTLMLQLGIL